jgi:hypothetical protein
MGGIVLYFSAVFCWHYVRSWDFPLKAAAPISGGTIVSQLSAEPFAANTTYHKPFFGIAEIFLGPIYRTTIHKQQTLAGSGRRVDMKAKVEVIPPPGRPFAVKGTINTRKLRLNRGQELSFKQFVTRLRLEICDSEMKRHGRTKISPKRPQVEPDVQPKLREFEAQAALSPTGAAQGQ